MFSAIDDLVDIVGSKISSGVNEDDWFYPRNSGLGSRQTPPGTNLINPHLVVKESRQLLHLADAAATRKSVLYVTNSIDVL